MIKIGKKGTEKILGLTYDVIAIVGVIILLLFVFTLLAMKADNATQDTMCRASVVLRGKASVALVDGLVEFEKITPLACHTNDLGKLKGNREEIKEDIAKYSAKCWWLFAEGSVADIFKVDRKEKSCFVCYTFSIDDNLDKGTESKIRIFTDGPEVKDRSGTITNYEMTDFLVSEAYNPGAIYGGGTKNYFGTVFEYSLDAGIKEPREIKPSKISSTVVNSYVLDYSYLITEETKNKINEIGVKLQQNNAGNMLVAVADEFSSIEPSDARQIIENTRLNTNDTNYDAILFMLDLANKKMRIQLGSDQSIFIKEYDLNDIMEKEFSDASKSCQGSNDPSCSVNAVNKALLNSITQVSDKLLGQQANLPGISPKSYYYYLTNGGYAWTIVSDIEPQKRYAITYVAPSDEKKWGMTGTQASLTGAVAAGVGMVAISILSGGIAIPVVVMGLGMGAGAGITYGAAGSAGLYDPTVRPSNIMIVPVNSLGDQCTFVE